MRSITDMLDEIGKIDFDSKKFNFDITKNENIKGKDKRVTINCPKINLYGRKMESYLVEIIRNELITIFKVNEYKNICVIGLGNREIINDSLGPKVLQKLLITRGLDIQPQLSVIYPNVYAQTGIQSAELILSVCKDLKPDLIIFIDALATLSLERLCTSFQIANVGIRAGSGSNMNNKKLTSKLLKCDLISIGVPMMIYAKNFLKGEKRLLEDIILSPTDTKKIINLISDIIADGINMAFFPNYTSLEIKTMIE